MTTPTSSPRALRVLIVDDNYDSAKLISMYIRACGHKTQTAATGKAALEKTMEFRPDIVLLDISLPDIDGFEVAREMKSNPELQGICLFAVTGWGEEHRDRAVEAGFDRYLVKPFEPEELLALIENIG